MDNLSNGDESFMRLALKQAYLGKSISGAGEVGCVIVKGNQVVAEGFTQAEMRSDPTAHAEIVAMRNLAERWKTVDLWDCTLYCTLQPCGMCSMACIWANIGRIVYGATRADVNSIYFEVRQLNTSDFVRDAFKADSQVVGGVLAKECSALYLKKFEPVPRDKLESSAR